jgi:DNA (cytosine-5)-methyltransferase 1
VAFGGNRTGGPIDVAAGLLAKPGSGIRQDFESDTFVVEEPLPFDPTQITHPENRSNPQAGDPAPTLAHKGHPPAIAYVAPVAGALQSGGHKTPGSATGQDAETGLLVAFNARQDPCPSEICQPLDTDGFSQAIAYAPDTSAPIISTTHQAGPRTTDIESGALIAHAFSLRGRDGENVIEPEEGEVAPALRTGGGGSDKPFVAVAFKPSHYTRDKDGAPSDLSPPLSADADKGDQDPVLFVGTTVRRLTPRECERLQGFEDDFTLIPYSDAHRDETDLAQTIEYLLASGYGENEARVLAATPDGPRYRALGNSQAVSVISDIGRRIEWLLEEGGW